MDRKTPPVSPLPHRAKHSSSERVCRSKIGPSRTAHPIEQYAAESLFVRVRDTSAFCRRLSRHTIQAYKFDLLDFKKWLPPRTDCDRVTEDHLKRYLENMVSERGLSPATVRRRLACLRSFFRRLAELGQAKDPFVSWSLKLPRRRRLPRALARSESIKLLNSWSGSADGLGRDQHMTTAFRLLVATGLRVGELCGLKLSDISPDCAVVRVHGKGSRDRVAYVADTSLRQSLKGLVASRRSRGESDGPLLVNRFGGPMKPQSVRSKLRRFAAEAGLERRVTPHMLRHTAATLLIETGVDIRFVQRLLGHSSIATTEIYTYVTDEALRATLERANILASLRT
jgi:integrase/recombinase XerD